MKHSFLKRLTAIVLVVIMVVSMIPAFAIGIGAAEETYTWTRVTSADTLKAGGEFIIGYEATANSGVIIPMANTGGATLTAAGFMYSGAAAASADKSTLDMTTYAQSGAAFIVTIAESTATAGNITIHTGTGYIGNTNTKNNCKLFAEDTTSNGTSFTPTVGANDVFTLKNANASYHTFSYNASSPRFACYGGTQRNLVIYQRTVIPAGDPECQHTNTETIPAVPATCTTPGKTEGTKCSDCGYIVTQQEDTPLVDHTDSGAGACSVCGKYLTPAAIVDAAYGLASGASLANGPYTLSGVITSVDEAYNTQYSNVTVTMAVTGADSDKPIKCYRLKGTGADVIAVGTTITVTGQLKNYNGTIEFDSGCTLDSYTLCEHSATVVIGADKDATCTEEGSTAGEQCSVCEKILVEETTIAPLGHKDANGDSKCDTCQVSLCTEHTWIDGDVVVEGNCTTDRVIAQTCEKCGEPGEDRVIKAEGHKSVPDAAVDATCTATGLTEGSHCSVCNEILVEQTVVPTVDHNYVNGVCSVCQKAESTIGFAIGDSVYFTASDQYMTGISTTSTTYGLLSTNVADALIMEVKAGSVADTYAFYVEGNGYIAWPGGTKNSIQWSETLDANSSWYITETDGVWSISTAVESTTYGYLAYNKSATRFATYKTATVDGGLNSSYFYVQAVKAVEDATPSIKSFGLSLNKGVTVRVSYDIPADWLAANPGAVLVFKDGDTVVGEPIAAVAGKNTYSVNLSPANINAALTVTLQTADGLAVGNPARDVSVAAYMAMVNADDMTAETLGISDEKLASLRALLTAVYTYGQTADGTHTGGLVEAFEGVGDLAPVQNAEIFTSVGATLGEYATVMLNVNAANIPASAKLSVTLWGNEVIKDGIPADSITSDGQLIIQNLWPANFASTITVTFASDGETVATLSFTFNEYLKALAGLDGLSEADLNRIIATYRYGVAAAVFAETA